MKGPTEYRHRQRSAVFIALLLFSLLLLIIQLWLFVSALEGTLAGHTAMVLPGAIISLLILAANVWMLIGLNRNDRSE